MTRSRLCMNPNCHLMREHTPDECGYPDWNEPERKSAPAPVAEPAIPIPSWLPMETVWQTGQPVVLRLLDGAIVARFSVTGDDQTGHKWGWVAIVGKRRVDITEEPRGWLPLPKED
jgi:hypothetical protein